MTPPHGRLGHSVPTPRPLEMGPIFKQDHHQVKRVPLSPLVIFPSTQEVVSSEQQPAAPTNNIWYKGDPPQSPLDHIRPLSKPLSFAEPWMEEEEEEEEEVELSELLSAKLQLSMPVESSHNLNRFKGDSLLSFSYNLSSSLLPTDLGGSFVSALSHSLSTSSNASYLTSPYKDKDTPTLYPTTARNPHKALVTINAQTSMILVANKVAERLFEYPPGKLVGMKVDQLFDEPYHSKQRALVEPNIDRSGETVLISGKVMDGVTANGVSFPVSVWMKKVLTGDSQRVIVVIEPVERCTGTFVVSREGVLLACDPGFATVFGYDSETCYELVDQQLSLLIPSILIPQSVDEAKQKQSLTGRTKDNTPFPLTVHFKESLLDNSSTNNDDGSLPLLQLLKGTVIVYASLSGMVSFFPSGTIHGCNHHFTLMLLGYSQKELIGKDISLLIPDFHTYFNGGLIHIDDQSFSESLLSEEDEEEERLVFPSVSEKSMSVNFSFDMIQLPSISEDVFEDEEAEEKEGEKETEEKGVVIQFLPGAVSIGDEVYNYSSSSSSSTPHSSSHSFGVISPLGSSEYHTTTPPPDDLTSPDIMHSSTPDSESSQPHTPFGPHLQTTTSPQTQTTTSPQTQTTTSPQTQTTTSPQTQTTTSPRTQTTTSPQTQTTTSPQTQTTTSPQTQTTISRQTQTTTSPQTQTTTSPQTQTTTSPQTQTTTSPQTQATTSPQTQTTTSPQTQTTTSPQTQTTTSPQTQTTISRQTQTTTSPQTQTTTSPQTQTTTSPQTQTTTSPQTQATTSPQLLPIASDAQTDAPEILVSVPSTSSMTETHTTLKTETHTAALQTETRTTNDYSLTSQQARYSSSFCTKEEEEVESDQPLAVSTPATTGGQGGESRPVSRLSSIVSTAADNIFTGFAKHKDSSLIPIIFQFKQITLSEEQTLYCVWLSHDSQRTRPPEVSLNTSDFNKYSPDNSLTSQHDNDEDLIACAGEFESNYKTLQPIGRGAFGFVKIASHREDGNLVVVKFIRKATVIPDHWVEHEHMGLVTQEICILSQILHVNIVQLLEAYENTHYFQLVMEKHGDGIDLFTFIEGGPSLDEPLISYMFRQVVAALSYLHERKILHRDVKDENIILNDQFHLKLIDFGSATYMKDGHLFNTFCGTLEYCSPEVLLGNSYAGPELEMWSLGVTLYTLVFGENPFFDVDEIITGHLQPPFLVSPGLMKTQLRLLHPDPKSRATLTDLQNDKWVNQPVDIEKYSFNVVRRGVAPDLSEDSPSSPIKLSNSFRKQYLLPRSLT